METKYTFCRIRLGRCGLVVDLDEATDRIIESADVWMFVGNNPLVSLSGAYGFRSRSPFW